MSTDSVYDPIPSLGHELGIIFGFAGLMLVSMVVYTVFWKGECCESFRVLRYMLIALVLRSSLSEEGQARRGRAPGQTQ